MLCVSSRPPPIRLPLALWPPCRWRAAARWRFRSKRRAIRDFVPISLCCAITALAAAALIHDAKLIALLFGFGSLGLMIVGAYSLAKAARWRSTLLAPEKLGGLRGSDHGARALLHPLRHGLARPDVRRLYVPPGGSDHRRLLPHKGRFAELITLFVNSMKDEYSLLPVLAPGGVLAATSPSSRVWYQGAEVALYAAPAYLALGVLARDLARRARRRRAAAFKQPAILALAVCGVFAAYPTGMAVVACGMPDIGGLVLLVACLRLSDRLVRLLSLPGGHDAAIGRLTCRVSFALALCLFGMFLFRRCMHSRSSAYWRCSWWKRPSSSRAERRSSAGETRSARRGWAVLSCRRSARRSSSTGCPIPTPDDYVTIYAAYRKEPSAVAAELFGWYGAALLGAAVCCAVFLGFRSSDQRLLRLTCGSTLIAVLLFLRVQSPAIHHAYLLAAFAGSIGAVILVLFERSKIAALLAVAGLAACTLTPAVSFWVPRGLAPTAGQPPAPRTDLAELARLKAWIDANARPDHRYCVLASSYTINDALVDELWQLDPQGLPLIAGEARRTSVGMAHVDTRDGPPVDKLKDCAVMMVGDPVQTHLVRAYQQTVIVPAREMLASEGIGAAYRRSGEVFHLEKGVKLVVFDRIRALDDGDIAALQARWRAAREKEAVGLRGTRSD